MTTTASAPKSNRSKQHWEDQFRTWAGGPGDTELQRCENAVSMIKKAIASDAYLKTLDIEVFAQGSFRNLTNIPQDSDVDVSVCLKSAFYYHLPDGTTMADFNITPSEMKYKPYKEAVVKALRNHFGAAEVTPGNKAIVIRSNTYRVDADVVANWEFRRYWDVNDPSNIRYGVKFQSDDGKWIENYPKQHIEMGIAKNERTKKRFKRVARILKSLQIEMVDKGLLAELLPSFFIESLAYNAADYLFGHDTYYEDVESVLATIFAGTKADADASKWVEVNDIKYLFHATQPWTKAQANKFALAAYTYVKL